ncbi:MAG: hypothetical protein HUU37_07910 [Bdellovibrionales bacterium]|nr:hypothetical protein [Bdellovibrionales bacterium]
MTRRALIAIFLPLLLAPALFLGGCGTKESIDPIYVAENVRLEDAHIHYWSDIEPTVVEPSTMRRVTEAFLRFFPVINQIVIFPMNLVNTVFPNLPSTSHQQLPKNGEWNDPKILKAMRSIRIGAGFIRITPEALRKDYEPEKCHFTFRCWFQGECNCRDLSFEDFLSEVRVYLIFKDLKQEYRDQIKTVRESVIFSERQEVLLASSDINASYEKENRTMHFNVSDVDLLPYMDRYESFDIKLVAVGKYPKRKVYIDGRLRVDLVLKLAQ